MSLEKSRLWTKKVQKSLENFKKPLDKFRQRCYNGITRFGKPNLDTTQERRKIAMKYNYSKLLGRIRECGFTQEKLAKAIGKNKSTVSAKINNQFSFTQDEMDDICRVLDIPNDEIGEYFFAR